MWGNISKTMKYKRAATARAKDERKNAYAATAEPNSTKNILII